MDVALFPQAERLTGSEPTRSRTATLPLGKGFCPHIKRQGSSSRKGIQCRLGFLNKQIK